MRRFAPRAHGPRALRSAPRLLLLVILLLLGPVGTVARGQETPAPAEGTSDGGLAPGSLHLDGLLTFYGDNTEFSNAFREGETRVGTFGHVYLEARLSEALAIRVGGFGQQRLGSDRAFDTARPVLALVVGGRHSRLVLGTLDTTRSLTGDGPDRTGPHGLLPPVQRDTLLFERPWETGMQWTVDTSRVTQDAWVHWQRLGTRAQREVFDVGLVNRLRVRPGFALRTGSHIVHHGGQISNIGTVGDSWTAGVGVETGGEVGWLDHLSLDVSVLTSRHVPDRDRLGESRTGVGGFLRIAAERAPWRLHAIVWRSRHFIKLEGDPQYQALQRDGGEYRSVRDYVEVGLTRTARLASGSFLEASARWHRVEDRYEYSFRILAVARLRTQLR